MSKEKSSEFNFSTEKNKKQKKESKIGFGKLVVLPFFVAIIATLIILFLSGFLVNKYTFFNNLANLIYGRQITEVEPSESLPGSANTNLNIKQFNELSTGIASKILPSVVGIEIEFNMSSIFGSSTTSTATGSGFIISEDGYILTNNHVVNPQVTTGFYSVSEASKVTVTLNSKEQYDAQIVGTDELTDLAVIKIEKDNLPIVEFGDSDKLQIGEFVMAVGRPLSFENSVTVGVISGLEREIKQNNSSFNAVQTDAAINSGNSGGPLVNADGKVIGVTTLKVMAVGVDSLNFAIPINQAQKISKDLIEHKAVQRPELGISGTDITAIMQQQLGLPEGILVQQIKEGSAAEKAGILISDIITKINDKTIKSFTDIDVLKDTLKSGDTLTILLIRSGKEETIKMTMP